MTDIRHFTSTAFLVHDDAVLLHWHAKVAAWLPAGGHIEPNEDPAQAALREVQEEAGIAARIVPTSPRLMIGSVDQVDVPFAIIVEDIQDPVTGPHKHIDFIYFTVPEDDSFKTSSGWRWFTRQELAQGDPAETPNGKTTPPPEDVLTLGLAALDAVSAARPT